MKKLHIYIGISLTLLCSACGEMSIGKNFNYGIIKNGNSIYKGIVNRGKKNGKGVFTDSLNRTFTGIWHNDTLTSGTRIDSTGVYTGQFSANGNANGHGVFKSNDGLIYEGRWKDDQKDGFGMAMLANNKLKIGEWKDNRYKGERPHYTSERIYGIDISKYQHIVGRKRYGINWKQLRITSLGTLSKKRITGEINYPISFIYIKSTEGKRLFNPYYKKDYHSAKANGLHTGTYHFFTPSIPARLQAYNFLKRSYIRKGDLPPVLDVEPLPSQIKKIGGAGVLFNNIRIWLRIVEQHTGSRPILYISQSFVNRYLPLAPDLERDYLVWIARYGEYKPDVHLVYWQLCPDGKVKGIHSKVDINVFNGYRGEFNKFISQHTL